MTILVTLSQTHRRNVRLALAQGDLSELSQIVTLDVIGTGSRVLKLNTRIINVLCVAGAKHNAVLISHFT